MTPALAAIIAAVCVICAICGAIATLLVLASSNNDSRDVEQISRELADAIMRERQAELGRAGAAASNAKQSARRRAERERTLAVAEQMRRDMAAKAGASQ